MTIIADKGIKIDFKKFNTDHINIEYDQTEKRNRVIHRFRTTAIDKFEMEPDTPNYKNYYPHIIPIINEYKTSANETVKLTENTKSLYNWYYSLVKDINKSPTNTELVEVVNNLTKDKTTELEKVRAIYYWVQNNVKYIAFEYALGGFIPREANDIYQKKYGDCKDNSSILMEMFKIANIKGHLTWIGTRSIPYNYNELPTPAVDNHMILTYKGVDNKIYFLDATGRYIPLELPTSFIQGKEALVGVDKDTHEILNIPVIAARQNATINSTTIEIDDKLNITGTANTSFSGYQKIDVFNQIESLDNEQKKSSYYSALLQKGNNKFNISTIKENNKFDYDNDFMVSYDFTIGDYTVPLNEELYFNLNLNKKALDYLIEDSRKTDIEMDFKEYHEYENTLIVPDSYTIAYLPENFSVSNDLLTSSITYNKVGNTITYKHQLNLNFLVLPKNKHDDFMKTIKAIEKAYKETIVLKTN